MSHYTQLAREERYQIYALMKAGHTQSKIAAILGRNKSTISREITRNRGLKGYRPNQADTLATNRHHGKAGSRITNEIWERVEKLIVEKWSPVQVSNWLKNEENIRISHEWIYQYILQDKREGGELYLHLRCQKQRRKRYGSPNNRRWKIKDRVSIDERPAVVDDRSRVGDWEVDTVIGRPGGAVLVTLVERKFRFTVAAKAPNKTAEAVTDAILLHMKPLADQVHTLTYDNGTEFAMHLKIAKELDADGYFAHPYHSWERGLNENTNGLLRQFFPKGIDLTEVTDEEIQVAVDKINNRPRECLGFKTPNQLFCGINPPVALAS